MNKQLAKPDAVSQHIPRAICHKDKHNFYILHTNQQIIPTKCKYTVNLTSLNPKYNLQSPSIRRFHEVTMWEVSSFLTIFAIPTIMLHFR